MKSKKHLTEEDRSIIEQMLRERRTLKSISERLGKSRSTVSREIRKHSVASNKSAVFRVANRCVHRYECTKKYVCLETPCRNNCHRERCSLCKYCNSACEEFEEKICLRLSYPPYVCNGCKDEQKCVLHKKYYLHKTAQKEYKELLSESRTGANITEAELSAMDDFVSPLIRNGLSVHHIMASNPDSFDICEKTLYRYINARMIAAKNYDMPRIIRMKPRKHKSLVLKIDKRCRIGRSFDDFLQYAEEHPDTPIVEMDSVIGRVGGKVLLTLAFRNTSLILAFLRDRNTSKSVIDTIDQLYSDLGRETFCKLFPIILTDNGSEFSNPHALEFDSEGKQRTMIFYCNPCAPHQKPLVEVTHEFIRRIIPKGKTFDDLSQPDIQLMMNNINSYKREKLNNQSASELFSFLYGQEILDKLHVDLVAPNDITLRPTLLIP